MKSFASHVPHESLHSCTCFGHLHASVVNTLILVMWVLDVFYIYVEG